MQHVSHRHSDEIHELHVEIEQLREALKRIDRILRFANEYGEIPEIIATALKQSDEMKPV